MQAMSSALRGPSISSSFQIPTLSFSCPSPVPPPTMPLPPLPVNKTRLQASDTPKSGESRRGSSGSLLPTPTGSRNTTPSTLPTLRTTAISAIAEVDDAASSATVTTPTRSSFIPHKLSRRTISISSFPQPPTIRRASQTSSPMSTPPLNASEFNEADATAGATRVQSNPTRPTALRKPSSKQSLATSYTRNITSPASTSLLNSVGQDKTITSAKAGLGLDALLHMPSPPESPASSTLGSALTDSTRFEDTDGNDDLSIKSRARSTDNMSIRSGKSTSGKDAKGNVIVSVRVRPDANDGDISKVAGEWMVDGRRSLISYKGGEGGAFRYDNVFSQHDQNSRVYDSAAKRLVRRVMEGYHGTVFAYGMTGTGKTFSMQGTAQSPGVIPLAITDIFSYIRENPVREFLLRVSYLEIYNERIYDLLSPNAGGVGGPQQEEIKLREDSKRGVYASPLKEEIVQSPTQLLRVIARGDLSRRTGSTQFNARSSRSHAVVQIVVESRERAPTSGKSSDALPGGVMVSTLSLIDLAGSEKAAETKERRTEGSHINKSLLTLGTVISRLSTAKDANGDKDGKHLPYRDSKLTRLLQPALSGNSLVSILCTIGLSSPTNAAVAHTGETLNTLNFASRAKNNIISHAKRNESHPAHAGGAAALLDRYRLEIDDLKRQLEEQNKVKDEAERAEEEEEKWREREREAAERHEEQMLEMQLARTALKERIGHLNRLILSSKSVGVNSTRFSRGSAGKTSIYSRDEVGLALGSPDVSRQASIASVSTITPGMNRSRSNGAIKSSLPVGRVPQLIVVDGDDEDEEPISAGSGEGDASLAQQVKNLQADLADKTRYISTMERRLLQTRRTSHGRPSLATSPGPGSENTPSAEERLAEKDREIDELRAKLDDQVKMVNALRSATRTRDFFSSKGFNTPATIITNLPIPESEPLMSPPRSMTDRTPSHKSQMSTGSAGSRNVNFSRLTPVSILSTTHSDPTLNRGAQIPRSLRQERSVEDMTRLLDEMIQQKVESGQTGGLQIKRDVAMHNLPPSQALPLAAGGMNHRPGFI